MSWARKTGGPAGIGVYAATWDMPIVTSPYTPPPPVPRQRKSPGMPGCPSCRDAKRGHCPEHRDFHFSYLPASGLG